jgi:hypothetical protein
MLDAIIGVVLEKEEISYAAESSAKLRKHQPMDEGFFSR